MLSLLLAELRPALQPLLFWLLLLLAVLLLQLRNCKWFLQGCAYRATFAAAGGAALAAGRAAVASVGVASAVC